MFGKVIILLFFPVFLFAAPPARLDLNPPEDEWGVVELQRPPLENNEKYNSKVTIGFKAPTEKHFRDVTGEERVRSPWGRACLQLTQDFAGAKLRDTECGIKVAAGKTSILGLAALKFEWRSDDLQTDFGQPLRLVLDGEYEIDPALVKKSSLFLPVIAKPRTLELKVGDTRLSAAGVLRKTLMPGQKNIFQAQFKEIRSLLHLYREAGTFPNPAGLCDSLRVEDSRGQIWPLELRAEAFRYVEEGLSLIVNEQRIPLGRHPGVVANVRIERIEVDDVRYTNALGESVYFKGKYQIFALDGEGRVQGSALRAKTLSIDGICGGSGGADRWPTRTGFDVFPGRYRVVVEFETTEGPQQKSYDLDLR